jgi:hypothetical protein
MASQIVVGSFPGAVPDRGSGVRGRVEKSCGRGAPNEDGTTIMKLTTAVQVSVDGVAQGNGKEFLKDIREAVSDRDIAVRCRGERPPTRGTPNYGR